MKSDLVDEVLSPAQQLKFLREFHGYSVREVARKAKLSPATVNRIENGGETTIENFCKQASALGATGWMILKKAGL